ncbi:MAG: hypothetical protein QOJ11_3092 [Frankiales bacterium]|jgi:hypothetical protein|nr:hypothetical protein [Frankiales bacterium]
MRYNPPPNWPQPPSGWSPPTGWHPDPTWPPPPPGWSLWLDDTMQRPWPARHKVLTGLGAFVVLAVIAAAIGGGTSKPGGAPGSQSTKPASQSTTKAAATSSAPATSTSPAPTSTHAKPSPKPSKPPPPKAPDLTLKTAIGDQDSLDKVTSLKVTAATARGSSVHIVMECHETLIDAPTQAIYEAAEQAIYASYRQKSVKVSTVVVSVTYPTTDVYGKVKQSKMITEELGATDGYQLNFSNGTIGYAAVDWGALWDQTFTDPLMAGTAPSR